MTSKNNMDVYFAGGKGQSITWEWDIENTLLKTSDTPFTFTDTLSQTFPDAKEEVIWNTNQIRDCDIFIVNLDDIEDDIKSLIQLGIIKMINETSSRYIYVIGLCSGDKVFDPWIETILYHKEKSALDIAAYIINNLL